MLAIPIATHATVHKTFLANSVKLQIKEISTSWLALALMVKNKDKLNSKNFFFFSQGFYDDGINQLCLECDPHCLTCDGSTKKDCKSC